VRRRYTAGTQSPTAGPRPQAVGMASGGRGARRPGPARASSPRCAGAVAISLPACKCLMELRFRRHQGDGAAPRCQLSAPLPATEIVPTSPVRHGPGPCTTAVSGRVGRREEEKGGRWSGGLPSGTTHETTAGRTGLRPSAPQEARVPLRPGAVVRSGLQKTMLLQDLLDPVEFLSFLLPPDRVPVPLRPGLVLSLESQVGLVNAVQ